MRRSVEARAPGRSELDFEVLATGLGFVEGPVLVPGAVIVVSLDLGHVYRIDEDGPDLLAAVGGAPNGAVVDQRGQIFIAQNGGHVPGRVRRTQTGGVQRVAPDGWTQWVTADPAFPTDLCFGPDGCLYVTDATRTPAYDDGRIWRCDPDTGASQLLYSVPWFPNGIAFGPDENLYVASTGERAVYVCEFAAGRVGMPQKFCELDVGRPDGLAFDAAGNLLIAAVGPTGVPGLIAVVDPAGEVVDELWCGDSQHYTNLALATDGSRLVLTDATRGTVLITGDYPRRGLELHPFRDLPG